MPTKCLKHLGRGNMSMKYLSSLLLLAGALSSGCQTATTTARNDTEAVNAGPGVNVAVAPAPEAAPANATTTPADGAPRISVTDAKAAYDAGNALFVDSRAEAAWKAERIKGSINIPAGTLDAKLKQLPKGKKIIVYCS